MRSGTCTSGPRCSFFFFNDTATTEIYPLSLHDALPISALPKAGVLHERAADAARAHQHDAVVAAQAQDVADAGGDRKSTRLNSSHGYISYAVFCLKKKKD